jgi:hypothetical protein
MAEDDTGYGGKIAQQDTAIGSADTRGGDPHEHVVDSGDLRNRTGGQLNAC